MKTKTLAIALTLSAILVLQGCAGGHSNAPVDDRGAAGHKSNRSDAQKSATAAAPAPVVPDPPGYYTVKKGDTLTRIAQQFNASMRDIADWNVLGNPNDVKAGQLLRVVPPEGVRAASVPIDTGLEVSVVPIDNSKLPQAPLTPPSMSTAEPPQARASSSLKRGPLGNKVVYSEQAWNEMQRGEVPPPAEAMRKTEPAGAVRFVWPTEGKLLRKFDQTTKGIDIAGQPGQPVVAVGDGTVLYAKGMRGYGNLVIIDHSDGLVSAYAHNKTILVREGQTVNKGQRVAEMGDSDAESVRLHFEIRQLGKPVDPVSLLPSR